MIKPEIVFRLYKACKMHFTTEAYDAIKYSARVKGVSLADLEKRRDKGMFVRCAKEFSSVQDVSSFFVSNFAYGNEYPIENLEKSTDNHKLWQRNRQSLSRLFSDDVFKLSETGLCYNQLITTDDGYPPLFSMFLNRTISIESMSILDEMENFTDEWLKDDNLGLFRPEILRIKKLRSFIKYTDKLTNIFKSFRDHETV